MLTITKDLGAQGNRTVISSCLISRELMISDRLLRVFPASIDAQPPIPGRTSVLGGKVLVK
jgi:hypothetical protein